MTASEKVAYLKGLMEGMKLDKESNEGKLFSVIADILNDIALDVEDVENDVYDLGEDIDALSDDLSDVEDILFGDDDDDWDDMDDWDDDDEDDGEPLFFEVTCPACDNTITVDEDVLNLGSIQCPSCGEMMEFEFDEDDEDDD